MTTDCDWGVLGKPCLNGGEPRGKTGHSWGAASPFTFFLMSLEEEGPGPEVELPVKTEKLGLGNKPA